MRPDYPDVRKPENFVSKCAISSVFTCSLNKK